MTPPAGDPSRPVGSEGAGPPPARGRTLRELAAIPVTRLHGLGEKKASALAEWGVRSVFDLLTTYPHRYIDRSRQADLADLAVGDQAVVLAAVEQVSARRTRQGRSLVELAVDDGTGRMKVVFFNQPWRSRQLVVGTEALFFGKLDTFRGGRQMANPVVDVVQGPVAEADRGTGNGDRDGRAADLRRTLRVIPVYPASAKVGLSSWEIGRWVDEAIRRTGDLADPLPDEWRQQLGLVPRSDALRRVHLPDSAGDEGAGRRRLAFDELFRLQLSLMLRRRALEKGARAIRHRVSPRDVVAHGGSTLVRRFLTGLPFSLTTAQRRALAAIFAEMAGPLPMHRLLQGDVGSGKTVVAVAALLAGVQGGHQGALMAPTEVLAEQHHMAVQAMVHGLTVVDPTRLEGTRPVSVALLTNRTAAAGRARLHDGLRSGAVDVVIGTHALLTGDVQFRSLGIAVIDEQHRFGVEQRAALREKGRSSVVATERAGRPGTGAGAGAGTDAGTDAGADAGTHADADVGADVGADPDLLVMTATPIPRTAAMVLFGDLDAVVLDELPPGRIPVQTHWARSGEQEVAAWSRVRDEAAAGNRAYVVCPLVDGSERVQARSATEELQRLEGGVLADLRLGLLHGQMPAAEKERVMEEFRSGKVQVLVATTVVEVGLDVPEATVMVVEDADRFGVAQLHQLRGRVGRSQRPSWCFLLAAGTTQDSVRRLEALQAESDGFALAEVDLAMRGEGTILGVRQKGRSDLKLARLQEDADLLDDAHRIAESITEGDPTLAAHPGLADEVRLFLDPEEEAFLFKS
ncbi:MAG: ATP-dependent DNA helicase RecG [Acidimicrobiales bacterium]